MFTGNEVMKTTCDKSNHGNLDCFGSCGDVIRQEQGGRWFITMGHPGFNSRKNNGQGYGTRRLAEKALKRYGGERSRSALRVAERRATRLERISRLKEKADAEGPTSIWAEMYNEAVRS